MINPGAERPIGYWLKKLDSLIDARFERQLDEAGLSRRQWQLLNLPGLVKAKVAEVRQALMIGISGEEYEATIDVLVRMAANLESD